MKAQPARSFDPVGERREDERDGAERHEQDRPHQSRRFDRATRAALAIFVVAVAYRVYSMWVPMPELGGDESVIGIMALHIAAGTDFPAFFYGQHYMDSIEAYLAVPFLPLFGPTAAALRAGTLLLYVGFFWAMYWTARRIVSPWFGVLTVALLAFGSDRLLRQELQANGGWEELLFCGALLAGLTASLCLPGRVSRRYLAYALWGLAAAVALWGNPLILPNLAPLGLVLLVFQWRELLGWASAALVAGFLVGVTPMVVHNVGLPLRSGTLGNVLAYNPPIPPGVTLTRQARGTLHAMSLATGMCDVDCQPWQRHWWGAAYPVLLAATILLAVVLLFRFRRSPDRAERVRPAMMLALAFAAIGNLAVFLQSIHSAYPVFDTARYLNNLLLATPAVLWPLWILARAGLNRWRARAGLGRRAVGAVSATVAGVALLAVFCTAGTATAATLTGSRVTSEQTQHDFEQLHAALRKMGVHRLYTDYFTCHKLIYTSKEDIICAPMEPGLVRGFERWHPYIETLNDTPLPYYVFATGSQIEADFLAHLKETGAQAQRNSAGGFSIYLPDRPLGLPRT